MENGEDDYMSSSFVQESEGKLARVDPRHDLPSWKRKFDIDRNTLESQELSKKRVKELEVERRELGLSEPITKENKGFKMLQKMGFSQGSGKI
jgi:hypothetical protein